jgi:hypothetical protein
MSSPHPTISAWTRDEQKGHYEAELHDWKLEVFWKSGGHGVRGLFHWEATRDELEEHSHEGFVEMEHAMADAEAFAALDARRRSQAVAEAVSAAEAG